MESFELAQVATRRYEELARTGHLSVGVYRLARGAQDTQSPHGEDEVYYVVRGRARFQSAGGDIAVAAGSVLFVPAGEEHRFHSIEEDLETIVCFGPAEGTRQG